MNKQLAEVPVEALLCQWSLLGIKIHHPSVHADQNVWSHQQYDNCTEIVLLRAYSTSWTSSTTSQVVTN